MHIKLTYPETSYKNWTIEGFERDGMAYQQLTSNGRIKMLNTPEITKDFARFLEIAEGNILINGLGMGMCNVYLLKKMSVQSLTVVEFDRDLVDFISPFFRADERCEIFHDDAFTFEPPADMIYDYVWHDIWTLQSASNWDDIKLLKKKYERISKWQGAWREKEVQRQALERKIKAHEE